MNNREILEQIDQLNRGIIPLSVWFNDKGGTVNELRWNSLTEDERRAAKRKFRKILRKACRKFGLDVKKVSSTKLQFKRSLVRRFLRETVVESLEKAP